MSSQQNPYTLLEQKVGLGATWGIPLLGQEDAQLINRNFASDFFLAI